MKNIFVVLAVLVLCSNAGYIAAQNVHINNNGSPLDASVILDVKSIDKGILLPSMTATQRSSIVDPARGLLVFQSDGTPGFYYYDGEEWLSLPGSTRINDNGSSITYALSTVFAGSTYGLVDSMGARAKFKRPYGLAADRAGNIYVADTGNHAIRKINPTGNVVTLAGAPVSGYTNGVGISARFNYPGGVTVDKEGNVYVADTYNYRIRKIDHTRTVTTIAGSGSPGHTNGSGTTAAFSLPLGLACDTAGNLYIADHNSIRKMTPAGEVTTLAGTNAVGAAEGIGTAARFSGATGLAIDATGNIYVADRDNHKIRRVTPAGVVTTFAGSGLPGTNDGYITIASFNSPKAIAIDKAGNFYVADAGNHKIRKITPDGIVTTLAGNTAGNTDGIGSDAFFNDPSGLVIDALGNLYVSDSGNSLIRKMVIR
jgi:streptogramin lyase